YSEDVITDLTLEWLAGRDPNRPFMVMCHFKATHEPFDYPARHARLYEDVTMPEPPTLYEFGPVASGRTFTGQVLAALGARYSERSTGGRRYPGTFVLPPGVDDRERRHRIYQKLVKDYLRAGRAIDDNLGRLLQFLDTHGLADNT